MFYQQAKFKKLAGEFTKTYTYKGLHFPIHQGSLVSISAEIELGGKITTKPQYAFFGGLFLTREQIRERVDIMVDKGEYKHGEIAIHAA